MYRFTLYLLLGYLLLRGNHTLAANVANALWTDVMRPQPRLLHYSYKGGRYSA